MTFWTISWQIKCSQKHIWVRCIYQFQSFRCSWTLCDWCIDHGLPQHQIEEGLFSAIQLEESGGRGGGKRFQHLSLFSACISSAFPTSLIHLQKVVSAFWGQQKRATILSRYWNTKVNQAQIPKLWDLQYLQFCSMLLNLGIYDEPKFHIWLHLFCSLIYKCINNSENLILRINK